VKKVNLNDIPEELIDTPVFTGRVTRQSPVTDTESNNHSIDYIHFHDGARNKFHTHSSDQVLIAVEGRGMFATEDQEVEMIEGDVIFSPAGEKHKHGAAEGENFTHISVTAAHTKLTQLED
jgi:4-carboxymuconolactone decarboxylase